MKLAIQGHAKGLPFWTSIEADSLDEAIDKIEDAFDGAKINNFKVLLLPTGISILDDISSKAEN